MSSDAWLVAGLGNPGAEYAATRHNIGFAVLDLIAERLGAGFKRSSKHGAHIAETAEESERLVLAKPQTYVNESGRAIASLARYYGVEVDRIILVYDELELAFGKLRIRQGGGTAGHNGLKSIVAAVGPDFVRVRLGIGRPPGRQDPADFVLSPFRLSEREAAAEMVERAADAASTIVGEGLGAAQNLFNRSPDDAP